MKLGKRAWRGFLVIAMALTLLVLPVLGCAPEEEGTVVFADLGWDSAQVNNRIASFILQHGYGYNLEFIPCDTATMFLGIQMGDLDVSMEMWVENMEPQYSESLNAGDFVDLGNNFGDNYQGWLVPTYMIEGADATAPGLKSVFDLPDYYELFEDPEDKSKGRFTNSIPGWMCTGINTIKLSTYDLTDYYTDFVTGSSAALNASMASAYEKGDAWLGYNWAPTWVLGKFDMTLVEEPAYEDNLFTEEAGYACAYPSNNVNVAVSNAFAEGNPDAVEFLDNFTTKTSQQSYVLAYMQESGGTTEDAAEFFLTEYEDLWTSWVPSDVADAVKAAL